MWAILSVSSLLLMTNVVTSSKVLLINMDGFRWDYVQNFSTPNFDKFAGNGVTSKQLTSSFITTYPCHYTIATESHGIVSDNMYDPIFNEYFTKWKTTDSKWWEGGEPLWVTVQKHGLRSGIYFWPGSEVEMHGKRPNIWKAYNKSVPFNDRVDTAIEWLSNDTYNIDLAMVYFNQPDKAGHMFGPYSQELTDKVVDMDDLLGYTVSSVRKAGLWDSLNVIVISDHGMTEIDLTNRLIEISQYIDFNAVEIIPDTSGAVLGLKPVDGKEDEIFTNLSSVQHMTVYRKEDLPERWHYKNNRRVLPIVLVADEGWVIVKDASEITETKYGGHGYDNALSSMKAIFFARGPDFKSNVTLPPLNTVDIYPLVCKLLDIEPAANNGSLDNIIGSLVSQSSAATRPFELIYGLLYVLVIFLNVYVI